MISEPFTNIVFTLNVDDTPFTIRDSVLYMSVSKSQYYTIDEINEYAQLCMRVNRTRGTSYDIINTLQETYDHSILSYYYSVIHSYTSEHRLLRDGKYKDKLIESASYYKTIFRIISDFNDNILYTHQLLRNCNYSIFADFRTLYDVEYGVAIDNDDFLVFDLINNRTFGLIAVFTTHDEQKLQTVKKLIGMYPHLKINIITNIPNMKIDGIECLYIPFNARFSYMNPNTTPKFLPARDAIGGVDYRNPDTRNFNILFKSKYLQNYEIDGVVYDNAISISDKYVINLLSQPLSSRYYEQVSYMFEHTSNIDGVIRLNDSNNFTIRKYIHDRLLIPKTHLITMCEHFTYKHVNFAKYEHELDKLKDVMINELYHGDQGVYDSLELLTNSVYNIIDEDIKTQTKFSNMINEINTNIFIQFDTYAEHEYDWIRVVNYYLLRNDYKLLKYCIMMKIDILYHTELLLNGISYRLLLNSGYKYMKWLCNLNIDLFKYHTQFDNGDKSIKRLLHFAEW